MRLCRRLLVAMLLLASACRSLLPIHPDFASVKNPEFLESYAATRRFQLGLPRSVRIVRDGSAVLFLRSGPRSFSQDLYEFDPSTGHERRLLTAEQILNGAEENLSAEELARRERMRSSARGIASFQLSRDGRLILVPLSGRLFIVQRGSGSVRELASNAGYPIDPRFSPDGRYVSCVRDGNLYVIEIASGHEHALTASKDTHIVYGLSEFVAQEEMGRFRGYWWSPDSGSILYQRTDTSKLETMNIMDAMHPEIAAHQWPYPRPGKNNAEVTLGVISVAGGETVRVDWDRKRYPYLATVRWKENAPLTILVQNRRQTEEALLEVDPMTGATSTLLVERDSAWLNLDQKMPHWLPAGDAFLWTSERSGSWTLELRHRDGSLRRALTPPQFAYRDFVDLDEERGVVHVLGSDDPTETQIYRFSLDDPHNPLRITSEPGEHNAQFSEDHSLYVHTIRSATGRRERIVRSADGAALGRLASVAERPPFLPNVELATVGNQRRYHAAIIRPRDFRTDTKYPVIVYVYGGPHAQTVRATPYAYLLQQWLADQGFVVVTLDGRGTPSRGRDWERSIKSDVISGPLEDQVDGLRFLGDRYPELDLSRVGIYGWSFGGYFSAMAVMRRPDVFHAGVAGAPVCDWLDYDTHYTERYMGLPADNASGYAACSVLTYCDRLERPLLIIHGTADDNVYFAHALKMSNELFRAGKHHEFLPLSDFTHMVADPLVARRINERILVFFLTHLERPRA